MNMTMFLTQMGKNACDVKMELQMLSSEKKNKVLEAVAEHLILAVDRILGANEKDMEVARNNGMSSGLLDRLQLTEDRIRGMAEGLRQIAQLPDCIGEVMEEFARPNGMKVVKTRVPMGVIGIIYEARPNVTVDAFGLCFKTSNAVILKGGSDALYSNMEIVKVIRETLVDLQVSPDAIQLIEDTNRATTIEFMKMKEYVDLLIPRGSERLIQSVVENSTIPVIETGTGNCHVYVDKEADLNMAAGIIYNAKTQRIGVCNACESLVVHSAVLDSFMPLLELTLREKKVLLKADERAKNVLEACEPASEEDFYKEYLDYILSIKTVDSLEEAIAHINEHNTRHSDCIVTENADAASVFLNAVDSACVYWNASTRFTDGFEFGFGAEIGISTQKLHARGPMGLKELTSYKYKIYGNGQVRE